jgi:hypothetical protein
MSILYDEELSNEEDENWLPGKDRKKNKKANKKIKF